MFTCFHWREWFRWQKCANCNIEQSIMNHLVHGHPQWHHWKDTDCPNCMIYAAMTRAAVEGTGIDLADDTAFMILPDSMTIENTTDGLIVTTSDDRVSLFVELCADPGTKSGKSNNILHQQAQDLTADLNRIRIWSQRGYDHRTIYPRISETTGSAESVRWACQRLQACTRVHEQCRAYGGKLRPKRLLDLSRVGMIAQDSHVKVIENPPDSLPYACVSYCWGGVEFNKLTEDVLPQACTVGVSLDRFPQSLREVLQFASQMGLIYVWVDSWCILQDSKEDKDDQMTKMNEIFGGSVLTLAISRSVSVNDSCFSKPYDKFRGVSVKHKILNKRFPDLHVRLALPHPGIQTGSGRDVHYEYPLQRRAWAFQESLLSPRVLSFGNEELVWECLEGSICQCAAAHSFDKSTELRRTLQQEKLLDGQQRCLIEWLRLASIYSKQRLTFESDRGKAFLGIEAKYRDVLGPNTFGMWNQHMHVSLLWTTRPDSDVIIYVKDPLRDLAFGFLGKSCIFTFGDPASEVPMQSVREDDAACDTFPSWSWLGACQPGRRVVIWTDDIHEADDIAKRFTQFKLRNSEESTSRMELEARSTYVLHGQVEGKKIMFSSQFEARYCFWPDHGLGSTKLEAVLLPIITTKSDYIYEERRRLPAICYLVITAGHDNYLYKRIGLAKIVVASESDLEAFQASATSGNVPQYWIIR